jgi:hypothetical protein
MSCPLVARFPPVSIVVSQVDESCNGVIFDDVIAEEERSGDKMDERSREAVLVKEEEQRSLPLDDLDMIPVAVVTSRVMGFDTVGFDGNVEGDITVTSSVTLLEPQAKPQAKPQAEPQAEPQAKKSKRSSAVLNQPGNGIKISQPARMPAADSRRLFPPVAKKLMALAGQVLNHPSLVMLTPGTPTPFI